MRNLLMLTTAIFLSPSSVSLGQDLANNNLIEPTILLEDCDSLLKTLEETHPNLYACIMLFELPNTKINIQNSAQYSLCPGGFDDQRGVLPDFKVEPTYRDYFNRYDKVLNYTYWLIDDNITNLK